MEAIKLLNIGTVLGGIIRLQSQLQIGRDAADFILEDGILKCWQNGNNGFNFYTTDIPYEIVIDRREMIFQAL